MLLPIGLWGNMQRQKPPRPGMLTCSQKENHLPIILECEQEATEETEKQFYVDLRFLPLNLVFSLVRSRQNQALDTVGYFHFVEINEQPDRNAEQLHVAQQLRLVNRENLLHSFGLYQHAAFDQQIETKRLLTREAFVLSDNHLLAYTVHTAQPKFLRQTPLIDGLDQTRTFIAMHLDGRGDYRLRQR